MAKVFIAIGLTLLLLGLALVYAPWLLNWFGNLPGDIHFRGNHHTIYLPITSMIVVSVVGTILLNIFIR